MLITRKSPISGKFNELDIDVTYEQIVQYHKGEDLIQDVFPNITPDEREFIKTGILAEEWDDLFPAEDGE